MAAHIKTWLKAPGFPDEDKTRVARLLYLILLIVLVIATIHTIVASLLHTFPPSVGIGSLILVFLTLLGLFFVRRGRVRAVAIVLSSLMWLFFTWISLINGGVSGPGAVNYLSVVLIAGLTIGMWAGAAFASLSIVSSLAMMLLHDQLPASSGGTLSGLPFWWMVLAGNLVVAAVVHYLANHDIVALHQARRERDATFRALQASEAESRLLVENALSGILMINDRYQFSYVNDELCRILGYERAELEGLDFRQVLTEEERQLVADRYRRRQQGETEPSRYELTVIRKDGERRLAELSSAVIRDATGDVRTVGQLLDITERRRALDELRRSEVRFRNLFEDSPISLWEEDASGTKGYVDGLRAQGVEDLRAYFAAHPEGVAHCARLNTVLDVNRATLKLFGAATKDELLVNLPRIFGPESYDVFWQHMLALAEGATHVDMETMLHTVSGEPVYVVLTFAVAPDYEECWSKVYISMADVTARVMAEQARRENEQRYRALFERTNDAVFILSLDGVHLAVNQQAADLLGYPLEEMVGMSTRQVVAPREYPDSDSKLAALVAGRPLPVYERVFRHRDGHDIPVEVNVALVTDPDGRPLHIQSVARDISERKRAEAALRESEERFRTIFENAVMGLYRSTPDGRVLLANPALLSMVGYPTVEALRHLDLNQVGYTAGSTRADFKERMERDGEIIGHESAWRRADGSPLYVRESARVVRDADGEIVYYEGTVEDISKRKRAEAEILRLQHLLQNITDSMPSALITLDPAGRVLTWNPAAAALTDCPADAVLGREPWEICLALAAYRDLFDQVRRERRVLHRHRQQLVWHGLPVFRDVSAYPLIANDLEGVVLRIDDVTRRVQLEEMMLQSAKMASVGDLAAGVAHEINNPLGAMMQSAQMLQLTFDIDRPRTQKRLEAAGVRPDQLAVYLQTRGVPEYLDGIRTAGTRAAKIVSDLLSFSRKKSSDLAPHNVNELVAQTLELAAIDYDLKKKYDFRDIEVAYQLDPDLPDVICDGQQVQQVVLNLVRNAAQAMAVARTQRGAEYRPRLMLRTALADNSVRLEVEDNGPGIPPDIRSQLFQPFFTTKEVGEGTGLGLWLAWSIVVERHRGRIWVKSGSETGSCFIVELPRGGDTRASADGMEGDSGNS